MMEYLFVYGTLRTKADNIMSEFLNANAAFIGIGYFNGKLYNAGEYPGAILSCNPQNKVFGNIYRLVDPVKVFRILDEYEEVGKKFPPPNEYKRKKITALLSGHTKLTCWIYLYNHPTDDLEVIPSGDYLKIHNRSNR